MLFSLQYLIIVNFRGVRKQIKLDFTNTKPGLYFVQGRNEAEPSLGSNGSGKSSIFTESIDWVLTGKTSRSQRPGSDVENWFSEKETTSVEIGFALDDSQHVITRTRNPNSLICDGRRVEQRDVDLLLPITDAVLRRSVLINQFGEMFLSLRPEAKSQIFTETLNLDLWLQAADRAAESQKDKEREIQSLERKTDSNKAASVEANSHFEVAQKGEEDFEDNIKALLAESNKKVKNARCTALECLFALDEARGAFGSSDKVVLLNDLRSEERKLRRLHVEEESILKSAEREIRQLRIRLSQYSIDKICPECGQKVSDKHIKEKRTSLLGEIYNVEQRIKNLIVSIERVGEELTNISKAVIDAEKAAAEQNELLAKIAVSAERSLVAGREVRRIEAEIEELKTRKNPFTKQCDDMEIRIKELVKEGKILKKQIDEENKLLEIYRFWQRGFREIRLEQIDATLLELELTTNKHAESLGLSNFEIGFSTERETKKGNISHSFSVFLFPPDQKDPISWESYSGGESQRWQLATTFGLAEVLLARSGITTDFEVIDEPTRSLSLEGVDDLLVCLKDRAHDLGRRIWLIDHHVLDRGSFDGVVTAVKTKERGTYLEDPQGILIKPEPVKQLVRVRL